MKGYDFSRDDKIQRAKDRRALMRKMDDDAYDRKMVQAKPALEIGAPDDKYEQEADAVAKKVVSGADAKPEMPASSHVQAKHAEGILMAKSEDGTLHGTDRLQAKLDSSKGGGSTLDAATKSDMGDKMGADLGGVKIHTDSAAQKMSEGINAKAFTHGQDIYFNEGNFDTSSGEGKELLAHELAHTVQQKSGVSRRIQRSVKFEIQTMNYVYAVKKQGNTPDATYNPDPKLLPRKFGTKSTTYMEGAGGSQESGPAYLSRGLKGEKPGDFIEMKKGPTVMEKAKGDKSKDAQFVKEYKFTKPVIKEDLIGTSLMDGQLELINEKTSAPGSFNPNTFEFNYYNADGSTQVDVHLDKYNVFRNGHVKLMKVGRLDPAAIDQDKKAQFIKIYKIVKNENGLYSDNDNGKIDIVLVTTVDNAADPEMKLKQMYYPGETQSEYYNNEDFNGQQLISGAKPLKVHVNETDKKLADGKDEAVHMQPQYLQVFEVPGSETDLAALIGKPAVVKQVGATVDNMKDPQFKNKVYTGTWKKKYYKPTDFDTNGLKEDAQNLQVHIDNNGILQEGHIKLLTQVPPLKGEQDGSTIEIQSEHGGVIEFETPKWFREWPEVQVLIQEAVDFTKAIDNAPDANKNTTTKLLSKHKIESPFPVTGTPAVKKWPAGYSTSHLKLLNTENRELVVVVSDPMWTAKIQGSESIELSEYTGMVRDYEGDQRADFLENDLTTPLFNASFTALNDEIKAENKEIEKKNLTGTTTGPLKAELNENLFSNLKGFIALVYNYIFRGQTLDMVGENSKSTFRLMARTNFASMYQNLLNENEKKLFERMLGDPQKPGDNPLFTSTLSAAIDTVRQSNKQAWERQLADVNTRLPTLTNKAEIKNANDQIRALGSKISRVPSNANLTRTTTFWYSGVGTSSTSPGPAIYSWLANFKSGKDLLEGVNSGSLSDAMGGKTVSTKAGDKDFMQAKFEIRGSNIKLSYPGYQPLGNGDFPSDLWVEYAKTLFDKAMKRSSDAPDNLSTAKGEASKTGLKEK